MIREEKTKGLIEFCFLNGLGVVKVKKISHFLLDTTNIHVVEEIKTSN